MNHSPLLVVFAVSFCVGYVTPIYGQITALPYGGEIRIQPILVDDLFDPAEEIMIALYGGESVQENRTKTAIEHAKVIYGQVGITINNLPSVMINDSAFSRGSWSLSELDTELRSHSLVSSALQANVIPVFIVNAPIYSDDGAQQVVGNTLPYDGFIPAPGSPGPSVVLSLARGRGRDTLAHEIGHFLLGDLDYPASNERSHHNANPFSLMAAGGVRYPAVTPAESAPYGNRSELSFVSVQPDNSGNPPNQPPPRNEISQLIHHTREAGGGNGLGFVNDLYRLDVYANIGGQVEHINGNTEQRTIFGISNSNNSGLSPFATRQSVTSTLLSVIDPDTTRDDEPGFVAQFDDIQASFDSAARIVSVGSGIVTAQILIEFRLDEPINDPISISNPTNDRFTFSSAISIPAFGPSPTNPKVERIVTSPDAFLNQSSSISFTDTSIVDSSSGIPFPLFGAEFNGADIFGTDYLGVVLEYQITVPTVIQSRSMDVTRDGLIDMLDVSAMVEAIIGGSTDLKFDVSNDGEVSQFDLDYLLLGGLRTVRGDLDLDGDVDTQDFAIITASNGQSGDYFSGDLDLDGQIDAADISLAEYSQLIDLTGLDPLASDLDSDGDVDGVDLGLFFANFTGPNNGPPVDSRADLDSDGDVDGVDLGFAFADFTGPLTPVNIPEPSSMALLAIAGILLAHRRCR